MLLRRCGRLLCAAAPQQVRTSVVPPAGRHPVLLLSRGLAASASHKQTPQWKSPPPQHEYWKPTSWLGAYYKLREGDEAAMRNRDRLMGKRPAKRGRFIVNALDRMECDKLEAKEPWRAGKWNVGDYLEVAHSSKAGDTPERVVGMLIGLHRRGLGSTFKLLTAVDGVAVEYAFKQYSPLVSEVILRKPSEWRDKQSKLYKMRPEATRLSYPRTEAAEKRAVEAAERKALSKKKKK